MSAEKQAAVLSGGGADGAYAVGVLKALCSGRAKVTNYKPLDPEIFTGTSIGSFNAAFLVSQWDEYGPAAVANLETVWLERLADSSTSCGNGVFRIRGNPVDALNPACYLTNPLKPWQRLAKDGASLAWDGLQRVVHVATAQDEPWSQRALELFALSPFISVEPMTRLLHEVIDYQAIRRAHRKLRVVTTNWSTGEVRVLSNADMTDGTGPLVIAASAAIPGFFPAVHIGSQPFVDGGVLMNTPLDPAIKAGAGELHVVYMDPEVKNIPLSHISNFPEAYYRMQQIAWANNVNDDISDAEAINRSLLTVRQQARGEDVEEEEARGFFDAANKLSERVQKSAHPLRLLTVRRYNPRDPLSGPLGLLNFGRKRIEALIRRGFEDTINHDPTRDVVPEGGGDLGGDGDV